MPADSRRAHDLFLTARGLGPDRRAAYLDQACGTDADLRQAVVSLLAAEDAASDPEGLSRLPTRSDRPSELPTTAATEGRLGQAPGVVPGMVLAERYRLTEAIGEGGMGSVWAAQQSEPVKRSVAVKLVKAGMDSKSVLARFEQERHALALMDHPNIAKVFDAGLTPMGQPFFVMELVDGPSLTRFCDEARLTPRQRLELFVPICQAVQHAHQKGIVHRDLKPGNILVTRVDGKPTPKVIDFGVAKAAEGSQLDMTMATQLGAVIGTLEYMAPEQAGYLGEDVDTRADIYSLGVILYEVLTGRRPIDARQLKLATLPEMVRLIQEVDPPRPSRKLASEADLADLAAARHTEPAKLLALLRGDLDWLVMKCLEKQRDRRYATANGLARDIQRFLADEVVEARPPSTGYRMVKFLRRNRVAALAGAAVTATLITGVVAFGWQARVARGQRDLARSAERAEAHQRRLADQERDRALAAEQAEGAQRRIADQQRDLARLAEREQARLRVRSEVALQRAELIAGFMGDTLKGAGPSVALGRDATMLREMMDAAAARIARGDLKTAPEAELRLRLTIGDAYRELAAFEQANAMLEPAQALARTLHPVDHPDTASALFTLGYLRLDQGVLAQAEPLLQASLAMRRRLFRGDHPDIGACLDLLGRTVLTRGDVKAAEPVVREALAMRQRLFKGDHLDLAGALTSLGVMLQTKGDLAGAEGVHREALAMNRRLHPGAHPFVAIACGTLGQVLALQGKLAEAEPLFREGLAMQRQLHSGDHQDVASALSDYAWVLDAKGDLAAAEPVFREAVAINKRLFPGDHEYTSATLYNLAGVLRRKGDLAGAETLDREALAMRRRLYPGDHRDIALSLNNLGLVLQARGDMPGAETHYRECLAVLRRLFPADHPEVANTLLNLGRFLITKGDPAGAEPILREGVAMSGRALGRDHGRTGYGWVSLGRALALQQRFAEAEPPLLEGARVLGSGKGMATEVYPRAIEFLVALYDQWEAAEPGKGHGAKAAPWRTRLEAVKGTSAR